ncbi:hypothetical protein NDU88_003855 [Pleurodeles waltl]|uniref:Uncharacterized protein n=1 Tax=Pleurodeles waltl TaxID=8319 RepID=A0AAV7MTF7_PLEWA|nr:hypothetical protein NDU88_003855 [Pleurodeles waltl]
MFRLGGASLCSDFPYCWPSRSPTPTLAASLGFSFVTSGLFSLSVAFSLFGSPDYSTPGHPRPSAEVMPKGGLPAGQVPECLAATILSPRALFRLASSPFVSEPKLAVSGGQKPNIDSLGGTKHSAPFVRNLEPN